MASIHVFAISNFELTKDTLKPAHEGKLWGVHCER